MINVASFYTALLKYSEVVLVSPQWVLDSQQQDDLKHLFAQVAGPPVEVPVQ